MKRCRDNDLEVVTMRHRYLGRRDDSVELYIDDNKIFLCEACLRMFSSLRYLQLHVTQCPNAFWIPGQEIYKCSSKKFVVFEIDGRKHISASYVRRLSILTKLFLSDKITLDDVHFFAFTLLFEVDDSGFHFAGYFSKEWQNNTSCINTLSCIMVLPPFKGKGYGLFLAELSYDIGRCELSVGTPERPLSHGGKCLFRKIWREEVMRAIHLLEKNNIPATLNALCSTSGLIVDDVIVGLHDLGVLHTIGRQGPLIVLSGSHPAISGKRVFRENLQWESMV